jgi:hypothetical protein
MRVRLSTGRALNGQCAMHLAALCLALVAMSFQFPAATAQNNEWEWVKGSKMLPRLAVCKPGVYGTFQKPAAGNTPGGRQYPVAWTDISGNFWLFGGIGCDSAGDASALDDLWEFNPTTREWAWMAGRSKLPGLYETQAPVYGTFRTPGKGNTPGARSSPAVWTDSKGNLWLFGGYYVVDPTSVTEYQSFLDDLWEFDIAVKEWVWMGGSRILPVCETDVNPSCDQHGVYGTLGVPDAKNLPGGRQEAASWTDREGNAWIFGGYGTDSTGLLGDLNDLWKFNTSTREWTWLAGSSTLIPCADGYGGCGRAGVYGTRGEPARGNLPGGRDGAVVWTGRDGEGWLFGGDGVDAFGNGGGLNDLWEFNPSTRAWAWMGGSNTGEDAFGVYGTLQTPATGNAPGHRYGAASWTDNRGDLWLFGGFGSDAADFGVGLNDLWKFDPSTDEWAWMGGNSTLPFDIVGTSGFYGALNTPAFGNNPGSRAGAASWTDSKGNLWLFGGSGLGYLNDVWEFQPYSADSATASTPVFSPEGGAYSASQTVTISSDTPGAAIYFLVDGKPPAALYSKAIEVSGLETIQAIAMADGQANSVVSEATYVVGRPPVSPPILNPPSEPGGCYYEKLPVIISDATPNATIYYTRDGTTPTTKSRRYTGPIVLSSSAMIEAIAIASGYSESAVTEVQYGVCITYAAAPTFEPRPGTYPSAQTVTISDKTPSPVIYYTTDGTAPTTNSTRYRSPIKVSSSETIQAIVLAPGYSDSPVSSAHYIIDAKPAVPNGKDKPTGERGW